MSEKEGGLCVCKQATNSLLTCYPPYGEKIWGITELVHLPAIAGLLPITYAFSFLREGILALEETFCFSEKCAVEFLA